MMSYHSNKGSGLLVHTRWQIIFIWSFIENMQKVIILRGPYFSERPVLLSKHGSDLLWNAKPVSGIYIYIYICDYITKNNHLFGRESMRQKYVFYLHVHLWGILLLTHVNTADITAQWRSQLWSVSWVPVTWLPSCKVTAWRYQKGVPIGKYI